MGNIFLHYFFFTLDLSWNWIDGKNFFSEINTSVLQKKITKFYVFFVIWENFVICLLNFSFSLIESWYWHDVKLKKILHAFLKTKLYFFFSFQLLYYAVKQKIYGFYNASSTIHSRIKKL